MPPSVLVVGSVNVDLFQDMHPSSIALGETSVDVSSVKGMTLPAKSFIENPAIKSQLTAASLLPCDDPEALVTKMKGPFEQKTGGKGANAAAAAAQTASAELICNFGTQSEEENKSLLADLKKFGAVNTKRSETVPGVTGTAYILSFECNDNAILLLGGANQSWPENPAEEGGKLYKAISESVAVMLQREIPTAVNVEVARVARGLRKPVFMDVGGTDSALDANLLPYITEIAPNETELVFISGVQTSTGSGTIDKQLVRKAVASLKDKFAAAGNGEVEVLVTLGSSGSVQFSPNWLNKGEEDIMGCLPGETQVGAFILGTEDGKPRDTTGAGDCFRGSYVAARYADGKTVAEAMSWAAAAGSLSVEVHGAMPSMPKYNAVAARSRQRQSPCLFASSAVEMRVSAKKSKGFYTKAAVGFLMGLEAKPATEDKKALEAKPAVSALRISGLGEACGTAAAVAAAAVAEGAATISSIKTSYPKVDGWTTTAHIAIDLKAK